MIYILKQVQNRGKLPITSMVTFFGFLDTHLLIPVMAIYSTELGAGLGFTGLIIGLYSITNTPANILFGRLIDKIGYKIPLLAGMAGDALSMFLYSLCRLPVHLALVRILHGITGGLVGPATMSATAIHSQGGQKGRTMAFYGMSLATATLIGYALSSIIIARMDYDSLFRIGALMLVIGLLLSFLLPDSKPAYRNNHDKLPSVSGGITKELLKRSGLLVSYSSIFAQYFTFGSLVTLLPIYIRNLGMETYNVGILLAIFATVFTAVQFPAGKFSDRRGRLLTASIGFCLSIISLIFIPLSVTFSLLMTTIIIYGLGYGILFPSVSALVIDYSSSEERGTATGIFHAALTAGVAIGAIAMGRIGETIGVITAIQLSSGVMVAALIIACLGLKRT